MVKFTHLGLEYEMTEKQIEAAFRYQQMQYRRQDAKCQLDEFIYGGDPDEIKTIDREMSELYFKEQYGMNAADAYKKIDQIVWRFDGDDSCNVDENTTWQNAIRSVLTGK